MIALGAHRRPQESAAAIQLSLRVRHPSMDPQEISAAIGIKSEHSFKAGDHAPGRRSPHTQTYWWAPVTVDTLRESIDSNSWNFAARHTAADPDAAAEHWRKTAESLIGQGVETMLIYALHRLNGCHDFLQQVQADGGDVSLILGIAQDAASDFTLPVSIQRLMVKHGIALEFKFER